MLTLLLSLLDKIVKLVEIQNEASRRLFEDHVNPIFQDSRIVYDDYRTILSRLQTQLSDPTIPVDTIASELRIERERNMRLRDELRRYSGELQNAQKSKIGDFVSAAIKLVRLEPTTSDPYRSADSPIYTLVREFEEVISPGDLLAEDTPQMDRSDLIELVGRYEGMINRSWENLSRSYYHLRSVSLQ